MAVTYNPFESEHGFKSPGFTVDDNGNVTVRSLSYIEEEAVVLEGRLYFNQLGTGDQAVYTQDGVFAPGSDVLRQNPPLQFTRGETYSFNLNNFDYLTWNIWQEDLTGNSSVTINGTPVVYYNNGISYKVSDTDVSTLEGQDAQGKTNGVFFFEVPPLAPETLYYGTGDGSIFGVITTADPTITGVGSFSSLNVIGDATFTGQDSEITIAPSGQYGTVTISPGGAGTLSNMYVQAITLDVTDTTTITPDNRSVTITPTGTGILTLSSGLTGSIDNMEIGQSIPRDGSFLALNAENGLNSTVIGNVTPEEATFTQATGKNAPVTSQHLTNKQYVDNTATALAIALGV
jgi:hypothetical protein